MLFNSLIFGLFLPFVFILHWSFRSTGSFYQNLLVLIASYIFYGWWDYRFLSLILISSLIDYVIGLKLYREPRGSHRRLLLVMSLCSNLGILGFFKYFGFFIDSFSVLLAALGIQSNEYSLQIILPVGISFYTFQTMSYTIDIYRQKLNPTTDIVAFLAFVSFFPQLVAGPIERASNLLPQFSRHRELDLKLAKDGLRQMLWGFFKKIVIADNLATHVTHIYENYADLSGLELAIGTFLFAIQIYCDFSGYSDIASGVARLFGIDLMRNFAFPYFSRDIAEFWRRWHISLSSWFRDYVYIPLGGSRVNTLRRIGNILVTFTVSGLWHGANWTFIIWGFLNGVYYIPLMLLQHQKQHTDIVAQGRILPSAQETFQILQTFGLTLLAWIFFRAESLSQAFRFIGHMFSHSWLICPDGELRVAILYAVILLLLEWLQRESQHPLSIAHWPLPIRWSVYIALSLMILVFGNFGKVEFIYFQF